ncbi:nuclear pore complex protein Nup88 [Anthonomus grandis grandis]|uniref:nuclear pore complex protein Nup88 n=1 Tax=Anthonomus grandis grandis TaxID=2921223 RepID=UPI0021664EEE|nr:nuclear pore complex protein Nup88 [Anthonomus grandis grandis]
MSSTDYLRLAEHKIFKEACEILPKSVNKPLNLIAVRDSVLFTWDFANNCVLSLNVKAARSKQGDNVIHQKLLPLRPPLFTPEFLVINESGTLLAVAGSNGVLVLQIPPRCPPYGAFDNNKELVYCRSYSLDEHLLATSDVVQVRQVKFHPGSVSDSHILVLTSDNMLRLYQIEKNEAIDINKFLIGEKPGGVFPGSKTSFLDMYGEIAVDFDFGFPDIVQEKPIWKAMEELGISKTTTGSHQNIIQVKSRLKVVPSSPIEQEKNKKNGKEEEELVWPVYILRGDFSVLCINIDLNKRYKPVVKCVSSAKQESGGNDACSIICLKTTPQIVCIASATGLLTNSVLLDVDKEEQEKLKKSSVSYTNIPDKELIVFETIELELGLALTEDEESEKYKCPIFLHRDESRVSRFFATHSAGVHTISINCADELHDYVFGPADTDPTSDIFINPSSAEYLVCTKTTSSTKSNPVMGFSLYYEPTSIITLLGDGSVVTLGILAAPIAKKDNLLGLHGGDGENVQSPLKKMLNEPFDQYIQHILKKGASGPLLKLSSTTNNTPEETYDLLQRAAQTFREEHFQKFTKAREELEKRVNTLSLLKRAQKEELDKLNSCKEELREKAEHLAEKYEDIKDKQDELIKKCEELVMLVARKKSEPSDAEKKFMKEMQVYSEKCVSYQLAIDKLKSKHKYQEIKIANWKSQETKKVHTISEIQANTIKSSLVDSTKKINDMIKQVNEYKALLCLK